MEAKAEAMLARAAQDRQKLFQRYDRGRAAPEAASSTSATAEDASWEDPALEVYHQTDRYGFIHDRRLPERRTEPDEARARAVEMQRVNKWLKMVGAWDERKTRDTVHRRLFKGIPDKMRSRIWQKLLDVDASRAAQPEVYGRMLRLARAWSHEAGQIDSDVNRQFRDHWSYRERYSIKQCSLFNVLCAYSMYNSEVGYCQGMSGVAAVLLMYMDEEEAFWAMSTLLSKRPYSMHGLYVDGFPKLTRFLAHHDVIMGKLLPKLKRHFDQYNLDAILYSLKWFFVIFIERIPFSLCLRVWDIYLLDGECVLTAMAYTILRLHKNKLLKLKDMDLIVQYIQTKLHKDFGFDDDYVIKMLEKSMDELRKAKLDLPPPATASELPQREFGVFVEPTFEAKVGIRKSIIADTEKELSDAAVLQRREREMRGDDHNEAVEDDDDDNEDDDGDGLRQRNGKRRQASSSTTTMLTSSAAVSHASNGQLNSSGMMPDSEDGGSFLGSSRKSLADTSVTSTADLSLFSTGPRSQHAFEITSSGFDDAHSLAPQQRHNDVDLDDDGNGGNGDLSPRSAFSSLSIVGRTSSSMAATTRITPTPTIMSPQDVVRIYVPAAPSDEYTKPYSSSLQRTTHTTSGLSDHNLHHPLSASNPSLAANVVHTNPPTTSQSRNRMPSSSSSTTHFVASAEKLQPVGYLYGSHDPLRTPTTSQAPPTTTTAAAGNHNQNNTKSTPSSRRGSLSRKSPSSATTLLQLQYATIDADRSLMECSHMRRSSSSSSVQALNGVGTIDVRRPAAASVLMTSFEQLAIQQQQRRSSQEHLGDDSNSIRYHHRRKEVSTTSAAQPNDTDAPPIVGSFESAASIRYTRFSDSMPPAGEDGGIADDSAEYEANDEDDDDAFNSPTFDGAAAQKIPLTETRPLISAAAVAANLRPDHHRRQHAATSTSKATVANNGSPMVRRSSGRSSIPVANSYNSPPPASPPVPARPSRIPLRHKYGDGSANSSMDDSANVEQKTDAGQSSLMQSGGKRTRQRQQIPQRDDPNGQQRQMPPPLPSMAATSPSNDANRFAANGATSRSRHDFDNRPVAPLGGFYQFNSGAGPSTSSGVASAGQQRNKSTDMNKIRIKINQNQ